MESGRAAGLPNPTWEDLGFSPRRFAANLAVIRGQRPELARLIEDGGIHADLSVQTDPDGQARVVKLYRRRVHRVEETAAEIEQSADEQWGYPDARSTLLVGLGTGERAARMLLHLSPGWVLRVYEPDPSLLVLALSKHDWTAALASGRLRLLCGSDLFDRGIPRFSSALLHPRLAPVLVRDWRRVHESARRTLDAPRERVAVLAGELLQEELATGLEESGADVWVFDADVMSRDAIIQELVRYDPSSVYSINFRPELAEIAARIGIAYGCWEIDPSVSPIPVVVPGSGVSASTRIFTWRKSRVRAFEAAGWSQTQFLPLAAHPRFRRPAEPLDPSLEGRVVFVGSSLVAPAATLRAALEGWIADCAGIAAPAWRAFLAEVDGIESTLRDDPCRPGLETTLQALLREKGLPLAIPTMQGPADVLMLAGERLAAAKRAAVVSFLSKRGLLVFGDEGWRQAVPGADWQGPLGHAADMNRVLSSAAAVIDIGRAYQPDIVTLRCFETTACGGVLIAEGGSGIEEFFKVDEELLVWHSLAELDDLVRGVLAVPKEARRLGEAGRRRCLADHTVGARLAKMRRSLGAIEVLA